MALDEFKPTKSEDEQQPGNENSHQTNHWPDKPLARLADQPPPRLAQLGQAGSARLSWAWAAGQPVHDVTRRTENRHLRPGSKGIYDEGDLVGNQKPRVFDKVTLNKVTLILITTRSVLL